MARYELSELADEDVHGIYLYTHSKFGIRQADSYLDGLGECLSHLAERPLMGRDITNIRNNYRCYQYQKHSVFYMIIPDGIRIIRVLHIASDVVRHL